MKCGCGGEMWPDSYEHPKRPIEWFMRCPNCGNRGSSVATFEEALLTSQTAVSSATQSSTCAAGAESTLSADGCASGVST